MNRFSQIFKKHPAAITFYAAYFYWVCLEISATLRWKDASPHINGGERLTRGEGIIYGIIFTIFIAIIFGGTTLIYAAVKKDQARFYLYLLGCIIIPLIALYCFYIDI